MERKERGRKVEQGSFEVKRISISVGFNQSARPKSITLVKLIRTGNVKIGKMSPDSFNI